LTLASAFAVCRSFRLLSFHFVPSLTRVPSRLRLHFRFCFRPRIRVLLPVLVSP
jgi:hypothetical protein